MLWVALELPELPLQLLERASESAPPLVVTEGPSQRPIVACANDAAQVSGVREGMTVAAAQALAGSLRCVPRDEAAEHEALERLAGWAAQFTSTVSLEPTGLVLEISGSLRLFGGLGKLLAALKGGVRRLGLHATFGIAPTPLAARVFARAEARGIAVRGCTTLPDLPARLAELPLFLLEWPGRTQETLADLGILRARDALALPRPGFAQRFGPEALALLDRLAGRVPDPRVPYQPPARYKARLELPAEADGVEAILFPLRRLLTEMEGTLRGRGAGVQGLDLLLEHPGKRSTRLALAFAAPEREADFILSIARERLGRTALPAPTVALRLVAERLQSCTPRETSWLSGREEKAVSRARLIERLSARLGNPRVFGIALANDHRPERGWRPSNPSPRSAWDGGARPAWLLNRPQRLVAGATGPSLQGRLDLVAGPERIETGWWDGEPVSRDYFVAANPTGETYWIYRERREPGAWYLHGVFA
ncbi:MAG: DNA polymerase Y family protein [Betaproteobacteria bacterium]|nr:DNA polymerase Y family protein [Betaproteobacteria bacterium]